MSAPKTPEECIVIVDPCEMSGDDSLCWDAVDSFATCSRITAYAAEKVREATEALSKENADLRARVEAVDETLFQASPEMELLYRERIDRALDLTRPFKEGV